MMSAPSATSRCAWAIAAAGSRKRPPSENESGVTLSTPITSGRPFAKSSASTLPAAAALALEAGPRVTFVAAVFAAILAAILAAIGSVSLRLCAGANAAYRGWLCADAPVKSSGSDCQLFPRISARAQRLPSQKGAGHALQRSVTDQRGQLFGVLDPAHQGVHRRQKADQFALGVDVRHHLRQFLRVAVAKFVDRAHASSAKQLGIFPADAFDPHAVGGGHPIQNALLRCPSLECDL